MGKKMKLIPFLHKPTEPAPSSSWPWPSCGIPKTLSFRDEPMHNSVHVATESCFFNSSARDLSADTIEQQEDEDLDKTIENVIRQARLSSERLFFDNHIAEATSPQLKLSKTDKNSTDFNKNNPVTSTSSYISSSDAKLVVMGMDSTNPFEDFKKSMQEVVEASGLNMKGDRDSLDQLLSWYLKFNCKSNHGYIVGAFIDLLVSLEISSASNTTFSSPTTLLSSGTSSCDNEEEDDEEVAAGLDHHLIRDQEANKISETS
ncbi:transcription repressor OFP15 [Daucus carota subsp. sativus]|uniref:transcription repressor OFP15 n=1 Tax=Daucus carota subsp. sativus TaxID=79200 RepID=UPI0007F01823|nr:PREDICTED: transcription repressor OFP15-like [Daucus carota subsp. sativus]